MNQTENYYDKWPMHDQKQINIKARKIFEDQNSKNDPIDNLLNNNSTNES